jgi:hypothetical protein
LDFKKVTTDDPPLNKLDYLALTGQHRANKLWKRTSKAGLVYQIYTLDKKVNFCVDHLSEVIDKIARKEGIEGNCVTASEIRFLFGYGCQSQVLNNLNMYNKDKKIPIDVFFSHPSWSLYRPSQTCFYGGRHKTECNTRPYLYGVALMPYYELSIEDAHHYPAGPSVLF